MKMELVPEPKTLIPRRGTLVIPMGTKGSGAKLFISDERARPPAGVLAERFNARRVLADAAVGALFRLRIVKDLDFARPLPADRRVEAYCLDVSPNGVDLSALTAEGLLRGTATLLQMTRWEKGRARVPCAVIHDWPDFRYRGAADWLVNVECNRWAYDWGDGRAAFLNRIRRNLDFCFEHKINLVWFDGFGWDTQRFRGYASLMKECNRYARRHGIRLEFGGYGGGYGTAYQAGELYRCGYFGEVFRNRRPYPGGKEYPCRGWPSEEGKSRFYGTCLSNTALRRAKIEEMKRFVTEVNPGLLYVHDIDAGAWLQARETWKQRCGACRKRWPNDDPAAADGLAGACASWFRQVRRELSALPDVDDYSPARDLLVTFTAPLYTHYEETKPEDVWALEKQYFDCLSREIGPESGIAFGLREMFYDQQGRRKVPDLRRLLDQNGNGHGIHILAVGGGDNYISDDLTNTSGAMAHFYGGAESVYLSNVGMHQKPVQMLNADFLWNGSAAGFRENPATEEEAVAVFRAIAAGTRKPPEIFAAGGTFDRLCVRLWGRKAGMLMSRALQVRQDGQSPVSHVWWTITQVLGQLKNDTLALPLIDTYLDRKRATTLALKYVRRAAEVSEDEDIHWLVTCLEVGQRFAGAVHELFLLRSGDPTAVARLQCVTVDLKAYIRQHCAGKRTDRLGGDPGCWTEAIAEIQRLGACFGKRPKDTGVFSDFIFKWQVSRVLPSAGTLDTLVYPKRRGSLQFTARVFPAAFCEVHEELTTCQSEDALVYFAGRINCAAPGNLELRLGYDGPVKVWIDGRLVFHDPAGTNPARVDAAVIPWEAARGPHEVMIALGANNGKAYGLYARFHRKGIPGLGPVPTVA